MSDSAFYSSVATILPDSIKTKLRGQLDFSVTTSLTASSGDGWIYAEPSVTHTSADILGTTEDYIGPTTGAGAVATGDKLKWIVIKHTGTTNGKTSSGSGVMISLDGTTATSSYKGIFLAPGEMIALKSPNATVADLHAITVNVLNGVPTAIATVSASDTVRLIVAGVLNNVG